MITTSPGRSALSFGWVDSQVLESMFSQLLFGCMPLGAQVDLLSELNRLFLCLYQAMIVDLFCAGRGWRSMKTWTAKT
jgi:hypothetical protein